LKKGKEHLGRKAGVSFSADFSDEFCAGQASQKTLKKA
jgi:hypothetical protein